jgi:protein-disulfide isomerase
MRKTLIGLTAMLITTTAAIAADMSEAEREVFRAEVRAYLLDNPEVLLEAMDVYNVKQQGQAAQQDLAMLAENRDAIFNDPNSWVGGNPDGDITIVEFSDYRCGYCRKAFADMEELIKSDGNIRFVVKELPILGPQSLISSQFAISVRQLYGDDAYKTAHDALISLRGEATPETMARLALELGHDPAALDARMASPEVMAIIEANHALATTMGIDGTPAFVVKDTMVRGYVPLQGMRQIVDGQRAG